MEPLEVKTAVQAKRVDWVLLGLEQSFLYLRGKDWVCVSA